MALKDCVLCFHMLLYLDLEKVMNKKVKHAVYKINKPPSLTRGPRTDVPFS